MSRKQNCDPNRSTRVLSSNSLVDKKTHNNSFNYSTSQQQHKSPNITSQQLKSANVSKDRNIKYEDQKLKQIENLDKSQQYRMRQNTQQQRLKNNKQNKIKNSRILAQIKQSKHVISTKRQQVSKSSNMSTTRTDYKPKFILKELITQNKMKNYSDQNQIKNQLKKKKNNDGGQQYESYGEQNYHEGEVDNFQMDRQSYQNEENQSINPYFNQRESMFNQRESMQNQRESMCANYDMETVHNNNKHYNQYSQTFNTNSPLGSETQDKFTKKQNFNNRKHDLMNKNDNIILFNRQKQRNTKPLIPNSQNHHQLYSKSAILSKRTQNHTEHPSTRDKTQRNTNNQELNKNHQQKKRILNQQSSSNYLLRQLNKPVNVMVARNQEKARIKDIKSTKTEQSQQYDYRYEDIPQSVHEYETFQQGSTIEYPKRLFNKKNQNHHYEHLQQEEGTDESRIQSEDWYDFESKIRQISATNPCPLISNKQSPSLLHLNENRKTERNKENIDKQIICSLIEEDNSKELRSLSVVNRREKKSNNINNKSFNNYKNNNTNSILIYDQINYKTAYLQSKKQLQIRSAYFNEAIQLCKHIIGNMKLAVDQEFLQAPSKRMQYCQQNCTQLLNALEEWTNYQ